MISRQRVATTVWTGCLLLAIGLAGCGSVALQPTGTAGTDGGAAGAAGGATGVAGSGAAGHGGAGGAGQAGAGGAGQAGAGGAGQAGAGGSDAGGSPGTVTLRLDLPATSSFCDMSCGGGGQHITILTRDGKAVPIQAPSCVAVCAATCLPVACPVGGACLYTGVAVTGAELKWDGSMYPTSTCGSGATCYRPTFAPAGKYIARMCATPGTLGRPADSQPICKATGVQSCVDVVFAFPGSGVVEGTLSGVAPICGSISAADYDQSCKVDADCVVVPQGDFCQSACTNCPNAAISAHAEMLYRSDLAGRIPAPSLCPCPAPRAPACVQNKCVL
jgi:hypothetical protein